MADLVTFVPKADAEAEQNLAAFISMCRDQLTLFNDVPDFNWNSHTWPGFNLAKLGNGSKKVTEDVYLDREFVDFARAYYRYSKSHNPCRHNWRNYALIAIEAALTSKAGSGSIRNISTHVLDEAARLVVSKYSAGAAYHIGREIRRIAQFLNSKGLVSAHVADWKSPVKRPNDRRNTGAAGRKAIDSKLPSDEAIMAMAEMFANDPSDRRTIFVTSVWAIMMGAGFRIGEILDLKINAEIEQQRDDGELRYGLRYEGEKGWGADIRWVERAYTDVCKEAFSRLLKLSEPARAFARHMEQTPNEVYRWDDGANISVDQCLSVAELVEICGSGYPKNRLKSGMSLQSIHEIAVKRLPAEFPWVKPASAASPKMKWSELLTCYRENEFSVQGVPVANVLWRPNNSSITFALGPRPGLKYHKSLFELYGYRNPDGSPMKITSHQARHFLDTVAERGGMSQDDIARFFGRADPKHNRAYNHMTDAELVQKAESLNKEIKLFGADEKVRMRLPVSTVEFNALVDRMPVHTTEYGFCVHDYTMSPCDKFRDCINCTEQVCVKGNDDKLARLKRRFDHEERQLQAHLRAMAEEKVGANRWYQHAQKTVARLKELIEILESEQIEEGAVIKLRDVDEHSHLGRAIAMRSSETEQLQKQKDAEEQALALVSQFELVVGEQ